MARCVRCNARRHADDLFFSQVYKDFVCRDINKCDKAMQPQNIRGRKQFSKKKEREREKG